MSAAVSKTDPLNDYLQRVSFWVSGVAVPQGSKVIMRGRLLDSNVKVLKAWRARVADAAQGVAAGRTFAPEAEIALLADVYLPRPKTVVRRRPTVKPDGDKLLRALCDAITDSGVWRDDAQVVSYDVDLWYADDKPGVKLTVLELA